MSRLLSHWVEPASSYDVGSADVRGRMREDSVRAIQDLVNMVNALINGNIEHLALKTKR